MEENTIDFVLLKLFVLEPWGENVQERRHWLLRCERA